MYQPRSDHKFLLQNSRPTPQINITCAFEVTGSPHQKRLVLHQRVYNALMHSHVGLSYIKPKSKMVNGIEN